MLAAIVFDFDGTIAETERLGHRVAYNAAFAELGLAWNWDEARYGELLAIAGGKERIAHYIEHLRAADVPAGDRAALVAAVHARKQQIFPRLAPALAIRPGVKRLIAQARSEGVGVAIATTAARASVDAVIEPDRDLRSAFAVIAAGDVVARKKPAPDIFTYACEALGVAARNCIAIEDSAIGLRAGRAAGMGTLVTISDYTRNEDFAGAAAVLSDLGEPGRPARTLAGPTPPNGVVDLAYLRELIGV